MKYIIGALLGANVMLCWFLGIHLTQTEVRVRHLADTQIIMQAELMICADKVKTAAKELLDEHESIHGP